MPDFVHLHVHSCYSFHEGTDQPEALVATAVAMGCRSLALTDTNGLYGAVPFVKAAAARGLRPLLGVDLDGGRRDGPRAVVMARGPEGYAALCRLVTARHLTWENVPERGEALSPAAAMGNIGRGLAAERDRIVVITPSSKLLQSLADIFPAGGLYGELCYTGEALSARRCRQILETCRRLNRPAVATNAVRFAAPEDYEVHRTLRAIGENGTIWRTSRLASPACHLKSPAEMKLLFGHYPETLTNTLHIASECAVDLEFGRWRFPPVDLQDGETHFSALWQRSFEGLRERCRPLTKEVVERLRFELEVIEEKGFSPYFLVVDDIVRQARRWRMRTVGRGSAACSLVSYCLGITHVDPIALGLHFERFLNPERSSPPDIDLDFSWRDRDRILEYVYETYGKDRVAMISTHVTFGPRAAVREIGKAHGLSSAEIGAFTRPIPRYGIRSLARIVKEVPECRSLPARQEPYRSILALADRIAGFPRHLSIHAGGIVISPCPITDLVPLERTAKGLAVTQYDMGPVEELGLIKIDLLSQRSLGVLTDAAAAVHETAGTAPPVDERAVILEDAKVRRLIREGETMGCFYIESPAMRSLLRKLRTDTFEDLAAASSVIRPGVAESGMMQKYIARHLQARSSGGRDETSWYLHPLLRDVLGETHGVMIYQEDVLQVAHRLAGMSLGAADSLRRSMSGKLRSAEAMARVKGAFLEGCAAGAVGASTAREVWRQIESFAGYAFCKAHSASYALLSFQVAWLKAHFPAPFMAAVISNGGGFYGTGAYISESRRLGLKILLPDVNRSDHDYRGRGREIRMGLGAVGSVNASSIDALLEARRVGGPFTCLSALRQRAGLSESEVEVLIRCGACDGFELTRPEMLWRLACGASPAADLFPGAGGLDALVPRLPEYTLRERCSIEKEVFGFIVSRHLLELLPPNVMEGTTTARAMAGRVGRKVRMLGQAIAGKRVPVKKGETRSWMKFLSLEDLTGTFEATLFPRSYRRFAEQTLTEGPYLLTGRIESDHGVCSLNVDDLEVVR